MYKYRKIDGKAVTIYKYEYEYVKSYIHLPIAKSLATFSAQTRERQQAVFFVQMIAILLSSLQCQSLTAFGTVLVAHFHLVDAGVRIVVMPVDVSVAWCTILLAPFISSKRYMFSLSVRRRSRSWLGIGRIGTILVV